MKSNKNSPNNNTTNTTISKDINTQKNNINKSSVILSENYSLKMLDYMLF